MRFRPHSNKKIRTIVILIFIISWQEWAEEFQTLDDLQSVNLSPEDEAKINQLMRDGVDD
jgi:hypothetical protein